MKKILALEPSESVKLLQIELKISIELSEGSLTLKYEKALVVFLCGFLIGNPFKCAQRRVGEKGLQKATRLMSIIKHFF